MGEAILLMYYAVLLHVSEFLGDRCRDKAQSFYVEVCCLQDRNLSPSFDFFRNSVLDESRSTLSGLVITLLEPILGIFYSRWI